MFKILKSFCCLTLFVTLNLCGASADYMFFYDSKPYKCDCCKKQAPNVADNWKNTKNSDLVSMIPPSEVPDYYPCYRKIGSYNLMCEKCKMEDHSKQIKELVLKFCPKFNFNKPYKEDVNYLLNNSKFLSQFPIDRSLGEEGNRICRCDFCGRDIDLLFSNCYDICKCGAPIHEGCMARSEHFSKCKSLVSKKNDKLVEQKFKFQFWVDSGCKVVSFLDTNIINDRNVESIMNSVYNMIASGEMENPFGDIFKSSIVENQSESLKALAGDKKGSRSEGQKCWKCFDCSIF